MHCFLFGKDERASALASFPDLNEATVSVRSRPLNTHFARVFRAFLTMVRSLARWLVQNVECISLFKTVLSI